MILNEAQIFKDFDSNNKDIQKYQNRCSIRVVEAIKRQGYTVTDCRAMWVDFYIKDEEIKTCFRINVTSSYKNKEVALGLVCMFYHNTSDNLSYTGCGVLLKGKNTVKAKHLRIKVKNITDQIKVIHKRNRQFNVPIAYKNEIT